MVDGDSIAQVAVVVLLLTLSVPALATAHDYSGTPLQYEESVTVDYSSPTEVSQASTSEGYGSSPTVVVNGTTLVEGEDYSFNASSGAVTWYNTTNSSDGASANIDYRAYQRTEESAMAWSVIAPLMSLFGLFGLIASVRALWQFTAEVWDL